jgi:DNA-binding transcriptional MerR regulator
MHTEQFVGPAEAAARLGISPKALRLYEQRGLVRPVRSEAGWRAFGPAEMARLGEVVALRALGLSLAQVDRLLRGDGAALEPALAAHQQVLEMEMRRVGKTVEAVRAIRDGLAAGRILPVAELARLAHPRGEAVASFELPWPWGGERFELRDVRPVTYVIGPLGSGKTRFCMRLAEVLPNASFLRLDRNGEAARAALAADADLAARVDAALDWLVDEGAGHSDALVALLAGMMATGLDAVVVDMAEHGLDTATQEALGGFLRGPGVPGRSLFIMTRSSAVLDLASLGPREGIILCPANHSPPTQVLAFPGAPGYETVASCLAPPDVRARTEGVVAMRQEQASIR